LPLISELFDSALLGYLRRRSRRERRCKGEANPFFSAEKEKYEMPKRTSRILAERVGRKLNAPYHTSIDLKLKECNPPDDT
jgi:hypothetical protein